MVDQQYRRTEELPRQVNYMAANYHVLFAMLQCPLRSTGDRFFRISCELFERFHDRSIEEIVIKSILAKCVYRG